MKSNRFLKAPAVVLCLWLMLFTSLQAQDRILKGVEPRASAAPGDTLWVKPGGANSLLFTPDGKYLACNSVEGAVILRDALTGNAVDTLKGYDKIYDFSPDNVTIATLLVGSGIALRNYHDNSIIRILSADSGVANQFTRALFTKDGTELVAVSSNNGKPYIVCWNVATGKVLWQKQQGVKVSGDHVFSVSRDGRFVALMTERLLIPNTPVDLIIRSGENGEVIETIVVENGTTQPIKFSPDSRYLAVCSDSNIILRSTETWEPVRTLKGHIDGITYIIFSPKSGFILATAPFYTKEIPYTGAIRAWNIETGNNVFTHYPSPRYIAINADSNYLAIAGSNSTAIIAPNWITTGVETESQQVQNFQASPNPAVNLTILSFHLIRPQQINLSIYSTDGRLLETLHSGMLTSGQHKFSLNMSSFPLGTYFARITMTDITQTIQLQRVTEGE